MYTQYKTQDNMRNTATEHSGVVEHRELNIDHLKYTSYSILNGNCLICTIHVLVTTISYNYKNKYT